MLRLLQYANERRAQLGKMGANLQLGYDGSVLDPGGSGANCHLLICANNDDGANLPLVGPLRNAARRVHLTLTPQ